MSMTTLTPTSARANLSRLLVRALEGEDIGIVIRGRIVALRPVTVESIDYALREHGATGAKLQRFGKPESSAASGETSKPLLHARVTDELIARLRLLSKQERKTIRDAMNKVLASWGAPHAHAGIYSELSKSLEHLARGGTLEQWRVIVDEHRKEGRSGIAPPR